MSRALVAAFAVVVVVGAACVSAQAWGGFDSMQWSPVASSGSPPPPTKDAAVAYDRVRHQLVLFGGTGTLGDTYIYNITSGVWRLIPTSVSPAPRFSMVSGIDQTDGRDRFVIALGEGKSGGKRVFFNDVWAFDLATEAWAQLTATGASPTKRYGAAGGTWFASSKFLFITHGFVTGTRYDDSFMFRFADNQWVDVSPSQRPHQRCLHAGALTSGSRVHIYGGCGSGGYGPCPARDAWSLDFDQFSSKWQLQSECPRPKLRPAFGIAPGQTGATARYLVMFGGNSKPYSNDKPGQVDIFDTESGSWTLTRPSSTNGDYPPVVDGASVVYANAGNATGLSATDVAFVFAGSAADPPKALWSLRVLTSSTTQEQFSCPFIFNLRLFHGLMMFLSWGFLLPIGVLIARFLKDRPNALWFRIHRVIQPLGLLLAIGGFIAAVFMVAANKFSAPLHPQVGIVVMALGLFQPLNAAIRPHPEPRTTWRVVWEYTHRYSGRIAVFLGLIQPFQGLQFLRAHEAVKVLYTLWFALLISIYCFLTFMGKPKESPVANWCWTHNPFIDSKPETNKQTHEMEQLGSTDDVKQQ